jgi:solute:Na+ symporter, SSS family
MTMNISLFIFLLFALQCFYWFVARRSSRQTQGKEDYFLAGRSVAFFPLMMTFLATQVGGGVVLGAAEEAYRFGWPVLLYPLGVALGLILLGSGIGRRLAGFGVSTVAHIFERVYGSTHLRKTASILSILSLFMVLVAQIIASSKFLVSLGFDSTFLFIVFWAIVILYTAQGGLRAVISTDMVQALVFSIVFLASFGYIFFFGHGAASLPTLQREHVAAVSSKFTGWLFMPLLCMLIEQDMGQRCFAGASGKIVSRAALWSGVALMLVCTVPVCIGMLAQSSGLQVPAGGSVLMTAITQMTGPWMSALVGCAVLAAIISTATSLINAISSNLLNDFQLSWFRRVEPMRLVKAMTSAISIAAIFFAFYFTNIVDLLIQSYELSVSCLFVPIFIAFFKKQGSPLSAWMAITAGAIGFCLFRIYPIAFPKEIASILLSLSGYGLGELLMRYPAKKRQIG